MVPTSWTNSVAVGVKTDGGLEVLGIFEDGVEGQGDDGALRECLIEPFGFPGFVQGDDELAVEEAVDVGLAGEGEADGAFGGEDEVLAVEEVDAAVEDDGVVALGVVEGEGPALTSDSVPRKISLAESRGVPRFHCLTTKG